MRLPRMTIRRWMVLSAVVALILAAWEWDTRLIAFGSPGLLALWLWCLERRVPDDVRRPTSTLLTESGFRRGAIRPDIQQLWDQWNLDRARRSM